MKGPAKTVAAIHDLSGVGRCALTVVTPVLSVLGAQVCPRTPRRCSRRTRPFPASPCAI